LAHPAICSLHGTSVSPVHFASSTDWARTWIVSSTNANDSTEQIIPADVSSETRLFIDACPNCPCDDRRIEGMRRAEYPSLCRWCRILGSKGQEAREPIVPTPSDAQLAGLSFKTGAVRKTTSRPAARRT